MKAVRLHGRGRADAVTYEDVPQPRPGPGEVLVRVGAAALIFNELVWDQTYTAPDGTPRELPIPGRDVSGTVLELGAGASGVKPGDAVYGMLGYGHAGALAERTSASPSDLAPRPRSLDNIHAAAVPLSALTAWQGLYDHAQLTAGQRLLVHGGAGGVGTYVVQLARWTGAHVVATASGADAEFVRELGADSVIDYATTRFEDEVRDVDVVFDLVGGETLSRSWNVVRPGGVVVSIVTPPDAASPAPGVRFVYFIVQPSGEQLRRIGDLIDGGHVRPVVARVFPLADARRAYEAVTQHPRGKVVVSVP